MDDNDRDQRDPAEKAASLCPPVADQGTPPPPEARRADGPRIERWRGCLKHLKGADVDALIEEMRGR